MIRHLTPELIALALIASCAVSLLCIVAAVSLFAWRETRRQAREDGPLRVLPREAERND